MDPPDCEVAAMRRGSYDDCAASLRPVSIDRATPKGKEGEV